DLAGLITIKLKAAATTDLIIVHSAMSAYADDDRAAVAALDVLCSAAQVAKGTRGASEQIGRRLLASILNLADDALLRHYSDAIAAGRCTGHHAVVHGLAYAALGVEPRATLLTFAYALAANQTAASLKLMRIGQAAAQAVLAASGEAVSAA